MSKELKYRYEALYHDNFFLIEAYKEGVDANFEGLGTNHNPHPENSLLFQAYLKGWCDANNDLSQAQLV